MYRRIWPCLFGNQSGLGIDIISPKPAKISNPPQAFFLGRFGGASGFMALRIDGSQAHIMTSISPPAIYLAGLPRSGTTWFGQAFSSAATTSLVDEPFNYEYHPEALRYNMKYLDRNSNDSSFGKILARAAKEDIFSRVSLRLPYRIQKMVRHTRKPGEQVVIKDVHTLLSLERVWHEIQPKIIVIMRHPAAVANSWNRLHKTADFSPQNARLLEQTELVDQHLSGFVSHITPKNDFFFNVGAYWGAVYYVVNKMLEKHRGDGWSHITHEHLCADPINNYRQLFESVGLKMTARAEGFLSRGNSSHESEKWRSAITQEQLDSVLEGVEPFGLMSQYYPREI